MSCCYCAADTIVCRGTCRHTALSLLQIPKSRLDCSRVSRPSTQIDRFLCFMSAGFFTTRLEKTLANCVWLYPVFLKLWLRAHAHLANTEKGSFCLKLFWVDGGVIVPLVKCLSCCLLFCLLHCQLLLSFLPPLQERCVVFGTHSYKHPRASRSLAGIAVWPFMVWWKTASPGLWSIQNPPHFTKYTGGKKRGVAFHACLLTVRFFF